MSALMGVDAEICDGVVRVRDGHDTWLCREADWDAAVAEHKTGNLDEDACETYSRFCADVARRGPVASINGTSRGDWRPLVQAAYAAELIDADDVRAYGVDVIGAVVSGQVTHPRDPEKQAR